VVGDDNMECMAQDIIVVMGMAGIHINYAQAD